MAIWREFRVQGFEKRVREVDQTKAAHTAHGTVPGPAPFVQRGRLPIKNFGFARAPGGPVEGGLQEAHPGYSSRTSRAGGGRQLHEAIPEGVHAGCQEQRWRGQVDVSANRAGPPSSTMMPMSLKHKLKSAYRPSRRLRHPTVAGRKFFQDKSCSKHSM